MDWSFIERFTPMYTKAAVLTLTIGAAGIVCAVIVGLVCAMVKYYAAYRAAVFSVFRASESGNTAVKRGVRHNRSYISGRELYGGELFKRAELGGKNTA